MTQIFRNMYYTVGEGGREAWREEEGREREGRRRDGREGVTGMKSEMDGGRDIWRVRRIEGETDGGRDGWREVQMKG